MIYRHELPMKLVDVHFSFDGSRLTFAFIADGRVDFRELVKDLTRHFNRTIRLHQIGIRDEARGMSSRDKGILTLINTDLHRFFLTRFLKIVF